MIKEKMKLKVKCVRKLIEIISSHKTRTPGPKPGVLSMVPTCSPGITKDRTTEIMIIPALIIAAMFASLTGKFTKKRSIQLEEQ
jgi:hypothetical protein